MALQVLREIAFNICQSPFITIMADETTNIANKEQVTIVIHWVTADFVVHEEFIGLYMVDLIDSKTIMATIMDVLTRLNLPISKLCGQCYDGASSMSGIRNGMATKIMELEPRALYVHCYEHSLSLAASDVVKRS